MKFIFGLTMPSSVALPAIAARRPKARFEARCHFKMLFVISRSELPFDNFRAASQYISRDVFAETRVEFRQHTLRSAASIRPSTSHERSRKANDIAEFTFEHEGIGQLHLCATRATAGR